MTDDTGSGKEPDIDAIARALSRILAATPPDSLSAVEALRLGGATAMTLTVGMRNTVGGDRRRSRRYALGQTVMAPAAGHGEGAPVMCLDIGSGGALVRLDPRRRSGPPREQPQARPAQWLGGRVITRRGALHHVEFPQNNGPLLEAELKELLSSLEQRDRRIAGKMSRLANRLVRSVTRLNDHGVVDLLWSDDYMMLPVGEQDKNKDRCISPASAALDAIVMPWLQRVARRLPGEATIMLLDRNGHVASACGPSRQVARWRGAFVQAPPLILAARFAQEPALAVLSPGDAPSEDMWLATAPIDLFDRRWGCVAVMRPIRPQESAAPSPAESDRDS